MVNLALNRMYVCVPAAVCLSAQPQSAFRAEWCQDGFTPAKLSSASGYTSQGAVLYRASSNIAICNVVINIIKSTEPAKSAVRVRTEEWT